MLKTITNAYKTAGDDVRQKLAQRVLEALASYVPPFCTSETFREFVGGNLASPKTPLDASDDIFAKASEEMVNDFRQGISNAFMPHINSEGMIVPADNQRTDNPLKLWIFSAHSALKKSGDASLNHSISACLENFLESAGLTRGNLSPVLKSFMFRFMNYGRGFLFASLKGVGNIDVNLGGVTDREKTIPYISPMDVKNNPDNFVKVDAAPTLTGPYKIVFQLGTLSRTISDTIISMKNEYTETLALRDPEDPDLEDLKDIDRDYYANIEAELDQINEMEKALSERIKALGFGLDQIMNNILLVPVSQLSAEECAKSSLILQSPEEKEAFLAGKTGILETQFTDFSHSQSGRLITKEPQPFEMPWGMADTVGNIWEASQIDRDSLTINTLTCKYAHNDTFSVYFAKCSGYNHAGREFSPGDVILCIHKPWDDFIIPVARKDALHLFPDLPSIENDARPSNIAAFDRPYTPDK